MKNYIPPEVADNSLILLWETCRSNAENPEALNKKLNDAFSRSALAKNLADKNISRFARAIYANDDTNKFVVATCYNADPQKPHVLLADPFFENVSLAIPELDIQFICVTTGSKYFKSCVHTDNASAALLAFDIDDGSDGGAAPAPMNDYIVMARKEVSKISGNLPRMFYVKCYESGEKNWADAAE